MFIYFLSYLPTLFHSPGVLLNKELIWRGLSQLQLLTIQQRVVPRNHLCDASSIQYTNRTKVFTLQYIAAEDGSNITYTEVQLLMKCTQHLQAAMREKQQKYCRDNN